MWITNQSQLIMEPNRKRWRGEEWNLSSGIMTKKAVLIHFQQNEIVDAIQHSLGDSFQLEQVENLDQLEKTENVTCVLALGLSFEDAVKIDIWCQSKNCTFFWAFATPEKLAVFCRPSQELIEEFKGENSRPENDLLVTEEVSKIDKNLWSIICTKKHHLGLDYEICVNDQKAKITSILSEKEFCATFENDFDCDQENYAIRLLNRNSLPYVSLAESESSLKMSENLMVSKSGLAKNFQYLLGDIVGCEVYSSIFKQSRLPTKQWIEVDISDQFKENETREKCELKCISILGQNLLSDAISARIKLQFPEMKIISDEENLQNCDLVISCGGPYESRSKLAEKCKDGNLKFIDAGISYQQGHLQTIFPQKSALFDSIVDYEDVSEEAPHCVTKSFPTNVDHCIQWAVRKVNSWQKFDPETGNILERAKDKFEKHFIAKPRKLLEIYPENDAKTWKKPKKIPKTNISLSMENELHKNVILSLVKMYKKEDFYDELCLALIKMRAFTYHLPILEDDFELLRRAKKDKICTLPNANLIASCVCIEIQKLKEKNLQNSDWWFGEKGNFAILTSKTAVSYVKIGKILLSQWDKLKVVPKEDWTIQDFIDHMETQVELTVELIIQNGKTIYIKAMPTHVKKKQKAINSLIKFDEFQTATLDIGVSELENLVTVQISSS